MRKWAWLAAAATMMMTTPALADSTAAPSTGADTLDPATAAALDAAMTKINKDDAKGAESDLTALVNGPDFAGRSPYSRAATLAVLGYSERLDGKPELALQHLAAAGTTYPGIRTQGYWLEIAYADARLKRDADMGDAVSNALTAQPDAANDIEANYLFYVMRKLKALKDNDAHRRQLLEALYHAHYNPDSDPSAGEAFRFDLIEIYADAGEDAKAKDLLPTLTDPDSAISLRADNRYRKLVAGDPDFADIKAMDDRYIAGLRTRQAAGSPAVAQALADALLRANRLTEAMEVVDNALMIGDLAPGAKSDSGDETKWLLDTRRRILERMGRWDDVVAVQIKARDAALKEGRDLVSHRINLADLYNRLGRPQDALKELSDMRPEDASIYGQMSAEQVRACAYAALSDKDKLKASLDTLRAHGDDAPGPLTEAQLCAGDEDGAAAALIARLDNPDLRNQELVQDQDYLPEPHPTAFDQMIDARTKSLLKRPDVRAAIAKYGVIESYPVFSPDS